MTADVRTERLTAANAALKNRHGRPFRMAVRAFVTAVPRIPDGAATEFSREPLAAFREVAARVVAEIADRRDDADDPPRAERERAGAIDIVRRTLEDVHRREERHLSRCGTECSLSIRRGRG